VSGCFTAARASSTLTEGGERFLQAIRDNPEELQASIANVATDRGVAGVLKVSMGLTFGVDYIVPLLPAFLRRYPKVHPDWCFETRHVDLIAESRAIIVVHQRMPAAVLTAGRAQLAVGGLFGSR
jgi:DNA-binding transcriptional LysR family regulator